MSDQEGVPGVAGWIGKLLREPLVHFLFLALLIFVAYRQASPSISVEPDRIVVSSARIEQLARVFTKTWQRSPTIEELKGLIDDFVREEIMY